MHAAASRSRILQRQVRRCQARRAARGSAGRLDGGGGGSVEAAPRGVWEQAHHLRGGDPDDEQVRAEAVWQGGGAEHHRHGVDRGAAAERRALDEALGAVTDALDALEHDVAAAEEEGEGAAARRWEERLAEAAALFQAFLHRHAAARASANPLDQPAFDYWFRPRVAETKNWFGVVCARRSERRAAAAAAPASVPATTSMADYSDPACAPPPSLSGDDAARLEARAAADLASLDGVDVYRLWRARGRPCAAHGGAGNLDLPGYAPRHRQRRGDGQQALEAEVDRRLAAEYGFDADSR